MEEKAEYLTDALEMIGVVEHRQIVTEVSGFIPVFEVVMHHYKDHMTALVFGRMWQYCGMADGMCTASLDRIGTDLQISAATVMRHAEKLVKDGFLIDTTPDRRNAPHEYLDGRKVEMKGRIAGGIAQRRPTVSPRNATVSESQLIKQDNTRLNNNGESSKEIDKIDAMLLMANAPGIKREARLNSILSYLGETFRRNTETKEWLAFAKYIDSEHLSKGWDVKVFVSWLFGQKDYNPQFWPVKKMIEFYPSAFVKVTQPEMVQEKTGLQIFMEEQDAK